MIINLLTEHHFEFLSLKGGCRGLPESTCQNVKLLEISCGGSKYNIYLVKYRAVLLQRLTYLVNANWVYCSYYHGGY